MQLGSKCFRSHTRLAGSTLLAIVVASSGAAVYAQDAPATEPTADSNLEEVVVTGSRIQRGNAQSAVPLQVLSGEDIAELGTNDLAELLAEIPGISDGISQHGSNSQIQTAGLSTVSLRRLGDDRTLVLINGKRAISNSGNSDRVSLSTIPSGLIERTEVTTGGASAVYGSDAIAGVVNFKLEDDYEGFELDLAQYSPEASGGDEFKLDLKYGSTYANDRGYFLISASLRDEDEIIADSSRPESLLPIEFDDPADSSNDSFANEVNTPGCDPNNTDRFCLLPSFSSLVPGGVFEGDAWVTRDGVFVNDQGGLTDRNPGQDFFADFDGFDFRPGRTLEGSRKIQNLGLTTTFELTDNTDFSFTGLYSRVESETRSGFETISDDEEFGADNQFEVGNIASDHPFIPQVVEDTRSGSVSFDRRLVELGEQARINDRETFRFMADVDTELNDNWDLNVYATYGHFRQDQVNPGEVNYRNSAFALDIEDDGAGGFQCVDAAARAAGCVPLNLFGLNSISPAAAQYISYTGFGEQTRDQFTIGGFVSGDLFEIATGPIKFAGGIEYRLEEQDTDGDPDGDLVGGQDGDPNTPDANQSSLATFPDLIADYDVIEGFVEFDVPIIADRLNFQTAARVGNYSTVDTIFSYNAGLVFDAFEDLRLRTQFSRSQRAPNLTEVFSTPRSDTDRLRGPCNDLMPDGSGLGPLEGTGGSNADLAVVAANCLAEPGIQAFFADPANAGDAFDDDLTTQGPNSGNLDVKEETADTFTFGFIWQPDFVPGFTGIVDYYRIEIEDAITSISTQDTVDLCYASTDFPNNRFCDVITRNQSNGDVTEVINFQENLETEIVEGIDASINYDFEIPGVPGQWETNIRYSHYLTDEVTFIGIGNVALTSTSLGEIESAENEVRARIRYISEGFRLTYTLTFEEGGIDDLLNDPLPTDDQFFEIGSQSFHRLNGSYRFGDDDRFKIYAGINNIFDNIGPVIPSGVDNGNSRNITSELNDIPGREYYAGFRVRF